MIQSVFSLETVLSDTLRGLSPNVGATVTGLPLEWLPNHGNRFAQPVRVTDGAEVCSLDLEITWQDDQLLLIGVEKYSDNSPYANHFEWNFGSFSSHSFAQNYASYVAAGWALTRNYGHCPHVKELAA